MKKSESNHEILFESLTEIEDDLLAEAYAVEDAEQLKKYIETEKEISHGDRALFRKPAFRIAAVAAVFVLIAVVAAFVLPVLFRSPGSDVLPGSPPGNTQNNPWQNPSSGALKIKSLDMLNYYSAIRILLDNPENAQPGKARKTSIEDGTVAVSPGVWRLAESDSGADVEEDRGGFGYDTPPSEGADGERPTQNPPPEGQQPGSSGSLGLEDGQTVIYYEMDPNEVFSVSGVIFFQIELRDESGYLASKVGTGIVDVVITENSLEHMITFRNGDRYYSCLENGYVEGTWQFSSHKYIEGFSIVKNLEQDNYAFEVTFDEEMNVEFICRPFKTGGENPDRDITVVSAAFMSQVSAEFTIADLEQYFSASSSPEPSLPAEETEKNVPVTVSPSETGMPETDRPEEEGYDMDTGRLAS